MLRVSGTKNRGKTLKLKKDKRREAIRQQIDSNPFITDHELSNLSKSYTNNSFRSHLLKRTEFEEAYSI